LNEYICLDSFYYIEVSLDSGNQVSLNVNGENILSTVPDNHRNGKISFVVNGGSVTFDYIVITTPK
jgi:hypothetical protein